MEAINKIAPVVLKATMEMVSISPKNKKDFSLEELQAIVKGHIEIVYLNKELIMVLNEEGLLLGLPFNYNASLLYKKYIGVADPIVGDVLVCFKKQVK